MNGILGTDFSMAVKILCIVLAGVVGAGLFIGVNRLNEYFKVYMQKRDEQEEPWPVASKARQIAVIIFGGIAGMFLMIWFGLCLETVIAVVFFSILAVIALTDLDTMEIPFSLNVTIFCLGILSIFVQPEIRLVDRLIGMVCVSAFLLIFLITMNGFGGGDVKLMFAAGFLLGWKPTVLAFIISVFVGAGVGVYLIATKKKEGKSQIPFGPYLCIGLMVATVLKSAPIDAYIAFLKSMITTE